MAKLRPQRPFECIVIVSIVDALELLQAYVGMRDTSACAPGDRLPVRAGRKTIEIGSAYLDKGEFAKDAPGASKSSPFYFYTQIMVAI